MWEKKNVVGEMGGVVRRREQLCGAGRAAACCAVERDQAAGTKLQARLREKEKQ